MVFGEVEIVYADDFTAAGVNDLLVKQIFLNSKPGFIRVIFLERLFVDVEPNGSRRDKRDLIVSRDERLVLPSSQEVARHAIRLFSRLDKEFADPAHEITLDIVGCGSQQLSGM